MTIWAAVNPCRRAFWLLRRLPSSDRGPELFSAFCLFATSCLSVATCNLPNFSLSNTSFVK
jgi:hypothetical protein